MSKGWRSLVYTFYHAPSCGRDDDLGPYHVFRCCGPHCTHSERPYVGGTAKNVSGTSNMWDHIKTCWGKDAVSMGKASVTKSNADESIVEPTFWNGKLTFLFD